MSLLNKKINKKYNRKYSKKNKYHMLGGMKIFIRSLDNKTITQEVNPNDTVDTIRAIVANHMGIESDMVRLVCKGKHLENGYTLYDYRIEQDNTITAFLRLGYCSEDKRRELEKIKNETDDMRSKREALRGICQEFKPTATSDYGDDSWLNPVAVIPKGLSLGRQVIRVPSDDPWADWERSKVSVLDHKSEDTKVAQRLRQGVPVFRVPSEWADLERSKVSVLDHKSEIDVCNEEIANLKQEILSLKQLLSQQMQKTISKPYAEPYD